MQTGDWAGDRGGDCCSWHSHHLQPGSWGHQPWISLWNELLFAMRDESNELLSCSAMGWTIKIIWQNLKRSPHLSHLLLSCWGWIFLLGDKFMERNQWFLEGLRNINNSKKCVFYLACLYEPLGGWFLHPGWIPAGFPQLWQAGLPAAWSLMAPGVESWGQGWRKGARSNPGEARRHLLQTLLSQKRRYVF